MLLQAACRLLTPHPSQAFPKASFLGFPGSCTWPAAPSLLLTSLTQLQVPCLLGPPAPHWQLPARPSVSIHMTEGHPRAQASRIPILSLLGHSQCRPWAVDSIDISS